MGYDLHIRRGEYDPDRDGWEPISFEEWEAYVTRSDDLRMDDGAETRSPTGEVITMAGPVAVWTGHPLHERMLLHGSGGSIFAKAPDRPTLARMLDIAEALGAHVEGDEGERYDRTELDRFAEPRPPETKRSLWQRLRGRPSQISRGEP